MGSVTAIQGRKVKKEYLKCRGFRHDFDGPVFQEKWQGKTVWIFYGKCETCTSTRTDIMEPMSCELIHRDYGHPDDYDGIMTPQEAKRILFIEKIQEGRNKTTK